MFTEVSTRRLSTICLVADNPGMHPSVQRLFDYAVRATAASADPIRSFPGLQVHMEISSAALTNWKSRGISKEGAIRASKEFGCSVNWLLTGEGAEDDAAPNPPGVGSVEEVGQEGHPDLEPIRVMRLRLKAGVSGFAVEPDEGESEPIYFRSAWLRRRGFKPYDLVATRVGGHSMEPTLYHDDLVVAYTKDCEPKDGEVFSINYEGEPTIKRLKRDGGEWWLTSDNSDKVRYPNKRWVDGTAIIIGRIVHRQSERI